MHRKYIRRWHKLLSASASLVAILAGLFVAPASAQAGPSVDMFWADVSHTNQSTAYFYLMTSTPISNLDAGDFLITGSATGCTIDATFSPSSFFAVAVNNCSDGTVGLQLGANSVSDLHGDWGPEFGYPTDFTIIDRTAPSFAFENVPLAVADPSFNLVATASEDVSQITSLVIPTISGDGCFIAGITKVNHTLTFAITGCNHGAQVVVTIYQDSFVDATGNTGPAADIVSPTINVAPIASTQTVPPQNLPSQNLPPLPTPAPSATPTSAPTSTPTPMTTSSATPTPTSTPTPMAEPTQAAVAPVVEHPAPPAPPVVEPEPVDLSPEQLALVAAPLAELPMADSFERTYAPPKVSEALAQNPEPANQSQPFAAQPAPQAQAPKIVTAVEPTEPELNLSWVAPVTGVVATALAAIGMAMLFRKRKLVLPRLRLS